MTIHKSDWMLVLRHVYLWNSQELLDQLRRLGPHVQYLALDAGRVERAERAEPAELVASLRELIGESLAMPKMPRIFLRRKN